MEIQQGTTRSSTGWEGNAANRVSAGRGLEMWERGRYLMVGCFLMPTQPCRLCSNAGKVD